MTYLAVAALTVIDGAQVNTYIESAPRVLGRITVTRTGYWAAAGYYHVNSGAEGTAHVLTADLRFNGVSVASINMDRGTGDSNGGVGVFSNTHLISAGQTIELWGSKGYNNQANLNQFGLRAYFMPQTDYRQ